MTEILRDILARLESMNEKLDQRLTNSVDKKEGSNESSNLHKGINR